jgi:hypothetical protein
MAWNRFPDFTCPVDIAVELFLRSRRPFHAVWLKRHDGSESTAGKLQQKIRRPQAVAGTAATVLCNWCAMRNLLSRRKKEKPGAQNSEQGVNILTWHSSARKLRQEVSRLKGPFHALLAKL